MYKIADLHCDLLCYLAEEKTRTAYNDAVRCSISQLRKGNVYFQGLPVFTLSEAGSSLRGWAQVEAFRDLPKIYPDHFWTSKYPDDQANGKVEVMLAMENASSFCSEEETLMQGLHRLDACREVGKILYISLTWNSENRFGGGALTKEGLKKDGKELLKYLHGQRIAADLSHASDELAWDILRYIDANELEIPLLASHSNMRAVNNVPRNIPDDLAKQIFERGGIIGLNFYKPFVGPAEEANFARHLDHVIRLGGKDQVCFGADFFYDDDLPADLRKKPEDMFFAGFDNSGCYPRVLNKYRSALGLTEDIIEGIAYHNLERFISNQIR